MFFMCNYSVIVIISNIINRGNVLVSRDDVLVSRVDVLVSRDDVLVSRDVSSAFIVFLQHSDPHLG